MVISCDGVNYFLQRTKNHEVDFGRVQVVLFSVGHTRQCSGVLILVLRSGIIPGSAREWPPVSCVQGKGATLCTTSPTPKFRWFLITNSRFVKPVSSSFFDFAGILPTSAQEPRGRKWLARVGPAQGLRTRCCSGPRVLWISCGALGGLVHFITFNIQLMDRIALDFF